MTEREYNDLIHDLEVKIVGLRQERSDKVIALKKEMIDKNYSYNLKIAELRSSFLQTRRKKLRIEHLIHEQSIASLGGEKRIQEIVHSADMEIADLVHKIRQIRQERYEQTGVKEVCEEINDVTTLNQE